MSAVVSIHNHVLVRIKMYVVLAALVVLVVLGVLGVRGLKISKSLSNPNLKPDSTKKCI